jgi:hypothetical protein
MSDIKKVECYCDKCISLMGDETNQSIDRLIFLLQLTILFTIISDVVMVFSIVALCLGWA